MTFKKQQRLALIMPVNVTSARPTSGSTTGRASVQNETNSGGSHASDAPNGGDRPRGVAVPDSHPGPGAAGADRCAVCAGRRGRPDRAAGAAASPADPRPAV